MGGRRSLALAVAAMVMAGGLVPAPAGATVAANPAAPAGPQIANTTASGTKANHESGTARVSGDGRYVAFASDTDDLVTNRPVRAGVVNVYLKDRLTGSVRLISHAPGGADGSSYPIDVSADGQYVTVLSAAANLVHNRTGDGWDVYRWDRSVDANTLVSTDIPDPDPCPGGRDSADYGSMSDDGQLIVFTSLVSPNCSLGDHQHVFVRDMRSQTTALVSMNIDGDPANGSSRNSVISGNGRYAAFESEATDLLGPAPPPGTSPPQHIYVRDLLFGVTDRVSMTNGTGADESPSINEDGSIVAYRAAPSRLLGDLRPSSIWVWDMFSTSTIRVDGGALGWADGSSFRPVVNADGTVVAFTSYATNLDPDGDTNDLPDVFVTDPRLLGRTHRVSTAGRGCQPDGRGYLGDLSADGTLVVFSSNATNLTHQDRKSDWDIYVGPTRSHQPTEESNCKPVND